MRPSCLVAMVPSAAPNAPRAGAAGAYEAWPGGLQQYGWSKFVAMVTRMLCRSELAAVLR